MSPGIARRLLLPLALAAAAGCSDDPGGDSAGGPGGSGLDEGSVWLLSDVACTPSRGACFGTLLRIERGATRLSIGERRLECGDATSSLDGFALSLDGEVVRQGSAQVGTFRSGVLEVTTHGGGRSLRIDFGSDPVRYRDAVHAFGIDESCEGVLAEMPDGRPVALDVTATGMEDTTLRGELRAARLPDTEVSYALVAPPARGELTGLDARRGELTYEPEPDQFGVETMTYSVSDGRHPATQATARLEVIGLSDPPEAQYQSVSLDEDTSVEITLEATDPDGDELSFSVATRPEHGTLAGSGQVLTYTPEPDFNGPDGFTFEASPGGGEAVTATVSLFVEPVNDAPVAQDVTLAIQGPNRGWLMLPATDVDDSSLDFAITRPPANGTISGGDYQRQTYVPGPGFAGTDSFSFTAADATLTSNEATVTVTVAPPAYSVETLETLVYAGSGYSTRRCLEDGARMVLLLNLYGTEGALFTDGTEAGTTHVPAGNLRDCFLLAGSVHLLAFDPEPAAFRIDSADGVPLVTIPSPDPSRFNQTPAATRVAVDGDRAYLLLSWWDASYQLAPELWATDGTQANTTRLWAGPVAGELSLWPYCAGLWSFAGRHTFSCGAELLSFSRAAETPTVLGSFGASGQIAWAAPAADLLLFEVRVVSGSTESRELGRTDGTPAGTWLYETLETGDGTYGGSSPAPYLGKVYFGHRTSLVATDGTAGGTSPVAEVVARSYGAAGTISSMAALGGRLFFTGTTDEAGGEPWVSDGTPGGTALLRDIRRDASSSSMAGPGTAFDGRVFFVADDGVLSRAIWSTDLTTEGTRLELEDLYGDAAIHGVVGDRLVYQVASELRALRRP